MAKNNCPNKNKKSCIELGVVQEKSNSTNTKKTNSVSGKTITASIIYLSSGYVWLSINDFCYSHKITGIAPWMKIGKDISVECLGTPGKKDFKIISINKKEQQ